MSGMKIIAWGDPEPLALPEASKWVGTRSGSREGPYSAAYVTHTSAARPASPKNSSNLRIGFPRGVHGKDTARVASFSRQSSTKPGALHRLTEVFAFHLNADAHFCQA